MQSLAHRSSPPSEWPSLSHVALPKFGPDVSHTSLPVIAPSPHSAVPPPPDPDFAALGGVLRGHGVDRRDPPGFAGWISFAEGVRAPIVHGVDGAGLWAVLNVEGQKFDGRFDGTERMISNMESASFARCRG